MHRWSLSKLDDLVVILVVLQSLYYGAYPSQNVTLAVRLQTVFAINPP